MSDSAIAVLNQTIIMFIIVIIGGLCYKAKLINDDGRKQLSNLVLNIVNPLLIFLSYQTDFRVDLLEGLGWSALMGAISYLVFIILSKFIFRNKNESDAMIERFGAVYSNCGFMGTPLIFGVFGSEGVFIQNGFITMFNLFVWTHGVMSMSGKKDKKSFLLAFRAPAVIAVILGLACFFLQLKIPEIPFKALNNVAEMTTPLAMIVAGASIVSAGILASIKNIRVYLVALMKLIVFPAIGLAIIMWFPCSDMVKLVTLIEISCPAAAIGTMFAIRFNRNYQYASQIFAVTTLLSALTLPLIMMAGTTLLSII